MRRICEEEEKTLAYKNVFEIVHSCQYLKEIAYFATSKLASLNCTSLFNINFLLILKLALKDTQLLTNCQILKIFIRKSEYLAGSCVAQASSLKT